MAHWIRTEEIRRLFHPTSTPLHEACKTGDVNQVKTLLRKLTPRDLRMRDQDGHTPCYHAIMSGSEQILDLLLKKDPNLFKITLTVSDFNDALHAGNERDYIVMLMYMTVINLNLKMLASVLAAGVPVNARCPLMKYPSWTVLHWACSMPTLAHWMAAVKLLIHFGASVHVKDSNLQRPLHLALSRKQQDVILDDELAILLLKQGCDPDCNDIHEQSPLFLAAKHGRYKIVKILLEEYRVIIHGQVHSFAYFNTKKRVLTPKWENCKRMRLCVKTLIINDPL